MRTKKDKGYVWWIVKSTLIIVLFVGCVVWDFSVLWPWTWRGYQTSFCSININCTLGTVLHLYYGSFWSNFSPKPASQRSFLRFWWKQMDRLRSDEDVLIITSLWTIPTFLLALLLCHIDACPVDFFSRRMCFCSCLMWPLARLSNWDIGKTTECPLIIWGGSPAIWFRWTDFSLKTVYLCGSISDWKSTC